MARKIKINKLPAGYHMMPDGRIMRDSDHMMNGGNILRDVSETGDFNLEAEGGETIVTDKTGNGIPEHYAIEGKRHSKGGVKMKESPGSFIFSDTPKMKLGKELNSFFNKSEGKSYTPAEIAKQYIDMNDDKRAMMDKYSDKLEQSTAALNMFNKTYKLGGLAIAQEAKKGFPDGIPQVAGLYAQLNGIPTGDNTMPEGMTTAKYGAQIKKYQDGEEVPLVTDSETLGEALITAPRTPLQFKKGERVYINNQPFLSDKVAGKWNPFKENYNIYTDETGKQVYIPSDSYLDQGIARSAIGRSDKQMNWQGVTPVYQQPSYSEVGLNSSKKYYQYQPVSFSRVSGERNVPSGYNLGSYNNQFGESQDLSLIPGSSFIYEAPGLFGEPREYTVVNPFISSDIELSPTSIFEGVNFDKIRVKNKEGKETILSAKDLKEAFQSGMLGLPAEDGSYYYPDNAQSMAIPVKGKKATSKTGTLRDQAQELAAPEDTVWGESFKYGGSKYQKGGPITPFTAPDGSTGYKYNGVIYKTKEAALAQREKDTQASQPSKPAAEQAAAQPRAQTVEALDLPAYEILGKYKAKPVFPQGWNADPNTTIYANTQALNTKTGTYEGAQARLSPWLEYWKGKGADVSGFYDASGNVRQLQSEDPAVGGMQDYITKYNNDRIDQFVAERKAKGIDVSPEEIARLKSEYTFADPNAPGVHKSRVRDAKLGEFTVNRSAFDWEDIPDTPPAEPPTPPAIPPPLTPPPASPPSEPPYIPPFPQDKMAVAAAFANSGFINKYPSWAPQVQLPRVRGTFFDPRYANAAAQSSAQMAMDASNAFAGNPSVARAMNAMYQGQSADKQIGNISDIGMKNVATANQMAGMNAEMGSKESLINAQFNKTAYDQNIASADAYDKERSANLLQNILPSAQNLLTNWAYAKSFPYLTPNYFVDTADAGTVRYTPEYAKKRLNTSTVSKTPSFEDYRKAFPDVSADKVAEMYSKQYLSGTSQTPGVDAGSMDPRMMMLYMQMMRNQQG